MLLMFPYLPRNLRFLLISTSFRVCSCCQTKEGSGLHLVTSLPLRLHLSPMLLLLLTLKTFVVGQYKILLDISFKVHVFFCYPKICFFFFAPREGLSFFSSCYVIGFMYVSFYTLFYVFIYIVNVTGFLLCALRR